MSCGNFEKNGKCRDPGVPVRRYGMEKPHKDSSRYILIIPYQTDEELDRIISEDILGEAHRIADMRNGCIEADVISLDDPERS